MGLLILSAATYPSTFDGAIQHENRLGVLFPTHQPKLATCCGERTLWLRGRCKQKLENSFEYRSEEKLFTFFNKKKKIKAKRGCSNEAFSRRHRKSFFATKGLLSVVSAICMRRSYNLLDFTSKFNFHVQGSNQCRNKYQPFFQDCKS